MKTKLLKIFGGVFLLIISSQSTILAQEWNLVWADEFNYIGEPDSTKWNYEVGFAPNQ